MKKLELILIFFGITLSVVILVATLFKYTKPSTVTITDDSSNQVLKEQQSTLDDSWINKISNKNRDFVYPTVIYKIKI